MGEDMTYFDGIDEQNERLKRLIIDAKLRVEGLQKEYKTVRNGGILRRNLHCTDSEVEKENERLHDELEQLECDITRWKKCIERAATNNGSFVVLMTFCIDKMYEEAASKINSK
jgi:hypothetical protein